MALYLNNAMPKQPCFDSLCFVNGFNFQASASDVFGIPLFKIAVLKSYHENYLNSFIRITK